MVAPFADTLEHIGFGTSPGLPLLDHSFHPAGSVLCRKSERNVHPERRGKVPEDILDSAQETVVGVMMRNEEKFKEIILGTLCL